MVEILNNLDKYQNILPKEENYRYYGEKEDISKIINAMKGKDITIEFYAGDNYLKVNGKEIKNNVEVGFTFFYNVNSIQSKYQNEIKRLMNIQKAIYIDYEYEGQSPVNSVSEISLKKFRRYFDLNNSCDDEFYYELEDDYYCTGEIDEFIKDYFSSLSLLKYNKKTNTIQLVEENIIPENLKVYLNINEYATYILVKNTDYELYEKQTIEDFKISAIENKIYTGTEIKPSITVSKGEEILAEGIDYIVSYKNNKNVGIATVIITGTGLYEGTISTTFEIKPIKITNTTITITNQYYTGKAIKYNPSIKVSGKTLAYGVDYTIEYKNNIKIGKATMIIRGKGNVEGSVTKTFNIVLAPVKNMIQSNSANKSVTIKWTKNTTVTGYEVYYSTSKNGSYKKVSTIAKNSTVTYKKTGLSVGKNYYFKVRAYKIINGKKYYSSFTQILQTATKPSKVTISNPTTKNGALLVKWKKLSASSGYEIYYSTSKSSGYKKAYTSSSNKIVAYSIPNLVKGKTYYVKVRAYKIANGKKNYGSYSNIKSIKVK